MEPSTLSSKNKEGFRFCQKKKKNHDRETVAKHSTL